MYQGFCRQALWKTNLVLHTLVDSWYIKYKGIYKIMKKQILTGLTLILIVSCNTNEKAELLKIQDELKMKTETGERNKESAKAFFKALEEENVDKVVNLFAEDAKHVNPYSSGLFPQGAEGKEEIRNYWAPVFPNFDGLEFNIDEIYAMEDPKIVFVKYQGKIKLKNNAGFYENDYYSTFKYNSVGKIIEYVEIFNPIVAARGFGLLDKIK